MMLLAALLATATPATETPRAFIERLYRSYLRANYNPLDKPERVFSPLLAKEIRRDFAASGDEVGYIDGDPLCDCQDYDRLSAKIRSLAQPNAKTATAKVHVIVTRDEANDVTLKLLLTPRGWRVADVVSGGRSLLSDLQRSHRRR